jgi:hypothetical protein
VAREVRVNAYTDEITMLLGHQAPEEHEPRKHMRTARTVASHRVQTYQSGAARAMLWLVCDIATANIFASHPVEVLTDLAKLCRRLLLVAEQAEQIAEHADGLA